MSKPKTFPFVIRISTFFRHSDFVIRPSDSVPYSLESPARSSSHPEKDQAMAGFRTHIATSTTLGLAYGAGAHLQFGLPLPTCGLAAALCSVSGMLPDIDSDSGVPLRESLAFAAAVVPMLMLERFREMNLAPESIVLAGAAIYLGIRFGLGGLLKRYTVHRGMFHSLPAVAIFGEAAFLICHSEDLMLRYYKAGAVVLGVLSHLVLDELWSIHFHRGRFRLKKSFGTAVKVWGDSLWANFSTYAKLALLSWLVWNDEGWMQRYRPGALRSQTIADEALETLRR
jgi:hypothetical protein